MPSCLLHPHNSGIVADNHSAKVLLLFCLHVNLNGVYSVSRFFPPSTPGTAAAGEDDEETPITYESTL